MPCRHQPIILAFLPTADGGSCRVEECCRCGWSCRTTKRGDVRTKRVWAPGVSLTAEERRIAAEYQRERETRLTARLAAQD